jgi:O-antigen/teichoic acid export membrane protein
MLLNVPMMVGLSLLSEPVILTLFGAKWAPAAPILSILAIAGTLYPLHYINVQLMLARGRSALFLRVEIAKKTLGILLVIAGSQFGVMGLAYSTVLFSVVALLINAAFAGRELGYGLASQLRSVAGVLLASGIMAALVLLARPLLPEQPPLQLMALSVLGAATFFGAGFGLRLKCFLEARQIVLAMRTGG